jgi:DNA-binding GntR family transcriptional regulator
MTIMPASRGRPSPLRSAEASRLASAQAYGKLRDDILALDLKPGQSLSEKDIAEHLGISRTPVREAFIRLAEEGLLDVYPQYGTFVAPIRISAVIQAAFIRDSLECSIVRTLAHKRRSAFLDDLHAHIQCQWSAVRAGDDRLFFSEDERMHQSFAEEAGHEPVWRVIDMAKIHVDRVRRLRLPQDLRMRGLVEEHERIAAAIAAQDGEAAAEAMHDHLDGIVRGLAGLARLHPDFFEKPGGGRPNRTGPGPRMPVDVTT